MWMGPFYRIQEPAAVGVVIRDHEGLVKLTAWRLLSHCWDAEEAEAVACREGIALSARWP